MNLVTFCDFLSLSRYIFLLGFLSLPTVCEHYASLSLIFFPCISFPIVTSRYLSLSLISISKCLKGNRVASYLVQMYQLHNKREMIVYNNKKNLNIVLCIDVSTTTSHLHRI